MPDPGTIQWPSHPYMLASIVMVMVMVVLGNVTVFPERGSACLTTRAASHNPWVVRVPHCFRYHWMDHMWRWAFH